MKTNEWIIAIMMMTFTIIASAPANAIEYYNITATSNDTIVMGQYGFDNDGGAIKINESYYVAVQIINNTGGGDDLVLMNTSNNGVNWTRTKIEDVGAGAFVYINDLAHDIVRNQLWLTYTRSDDSYTSCYVNYINLTNLSDNGAFTYAGTSDNNEVTHNQCGIAVNNNGTVMVIVQPECTDNHEETDVLKCPSTSTCRLAGNYTATELANCSFAGPSYTDSWRADITSYENKFYVAFSTDYTNASGIETVRYSEYNGSNWSIVEEVEYRAGGVTDPEIIYNPTIHKPVIFANGDIEADTIFDVIVSIRDNTTGWSNWLKIGYNDAYTYPLSVSMDGNDMLVSFDEINASNITGVFNTSKEDFNYDTNIGLQNSSGGNSFKGWQEAGTLCTISSSNYLTCSDTSGTIAQSANKTVPTMKPTRIDWKAYVDDNNEGGYYKIQNSDNTIAFYISINNFSLMAGTDNETIMNITNNQWYNISLRQINWTNSTYNLFVDNVMVKSNETFQNSTNGMNHIIMGTTTTASGIEIRMDDITIYEPYITQTTNTFYPKILRSTDNGTTWLVDTTFPKQASNYVWAEAENTYGAKLMWDPQSNNNQGTCAVYTATYGHWNGLLIIDEDTYFNPEGDFSCQLDANEYEITANATATYTNLTASEDIALNCNYTYNGTPSCIQITHYIHNLNESETTEMYTTNAQNTTYAIPATDVFDNLTYQCQVCIGLNCTNSSNTTIGQITDSVIPVRIFDYLGRLIEGINYNITVNGNTYTSNPQNFLLSTWVNQSGANYNETFNITDNTGYNYNEAVNVYITEETQDINITLDPYQLILNFTNATTGIIATNNTYEWFNKTANQTLIINVTGQPEGRTYVMFGMINYDNYTQQYTFDKNTSAITNERIKIISTNTAQQYNGYLKIYDSSNAPIEDATVRIYQSDIANVSGNYTLIDQIITEGDAIVKYWADVNTIIKVTVSKTGYETAFTILPVRNVMNDTEDNAPIIYLPKEGEQMGIYTIVWLPREVEDKSQNISGYIKTGIGTEIDMTTAYRAGNGLTERAIDDNCVTFMLEKVCLFTLESGTDINATAGNETVYIYLDNVLTKAVLIEKIEPRQEIFPESNFTPLDWKTKVVICLIASLVITILGQFLIHGEKSAVPIFVGALVVTSLVAGNFMFIISILGLYGILRLIQKVIKE